MLTVDWKFPVRLTALAYRYISNYQGDQRGQLKMQERVVTSREVVLCDELRLSRDKKLSGDWELS